MPRIMGCRFRRKACAACRRLCGCGFSDMSSWIRSYVHILLAYIMVAQQPEPPITTFKSSANLVIINVFVRDKSGRAIEGLKKEDFKLLEDGKSQNISVFEFQKLEDPAPAPARPRPATLAVRPAESPKPAEPKQAASIQPSKPGEVRYRDRRLIALLFDFSSMPQPDQIRAQAAA